jgi:outer membrane protein OmpA-like peptidoglycan-associated protein
MQTARFRTALLVFVCAGAVLVAGCATKKALREGLSVQDTKIAGVESQVEDAQKRIDETNHKVEAVGYSAEEARRLGSDAGAKAGQAGARADEAYTLAKGKLLYTVVLNETANHFPFNAAKLTDDARKTLDELAERLKSQNENVYLEIQGHTDSTGDNEYNVTLGQHRAEEVRRYLNMTHGIPLHKMSVISFGETKPVADNGSRDGRAQNRRVEVHILS